ncbi:MAG: hypothetical protein M3O84_05550 [Actinomycetota bacterium]|nr:hypothetical protein [Actinomycetota bacterium]
MALSCRLLVDPWSLHYFSSARIKQRRPICDLEHLPGVCDAGCEWLHVDFDDHLRSFHFDACGFTPTNAGLIAL